MWSSSDPRQSTRAQSDTAATQSGRQDLNLRPLGPKPSALARLSYAPEVWIESRAGYDGRQCGAYRACQQPVLAGIGLPGLRISEDRSSMSPLAVARSMIGDETKASQVSGAAGLRPVTYG